MSDPRFFDLSQIRHVRDGDPVSEQITAQPTRAIERRLQQQAQLLAESAASINSKFIIYDVAIKSGTGAPSLWDVVYFNAGTGMYEPAQAGVTFMSDAFQFNATALGIGLLIGSRGDRGDVFVLGYDTWSTNDLRYTTMLEPTETFQPGPYYLSADYPGKLTRFPPALRVQILISTANHFVLQPSYSNPDSVENIFTLPLGMRPVGGLRLLPPNYDQMAVVAFDGLELYDTTQSLWRPTSSSTVEALQEFGWLVADASITTAPAAPFYVRVEVATSGAVSVFSANTLAELYTGSAGIFNSTSPTSLVSNPNTLRLYSLQDSSANDIGQLSFRFTSSDRSLARTAIFKIPDSFQGWKMVNAPIQPTASATVASGAVTAVQVTEGSFGYTTAPAVSFTGGGGTAAAGVAVLGPVGNVIGVTVTNGGSNYTSAPTVVFDSQLTGAALQNGGSGATATVAVLNNQLYSTVITAAGSGYVEAPLVEILDTTGSGGQITAEVQNGQVTKLTVTENGAGYTAPTLRLIPATNYGYQTTSGLTPGCYVQGGNPTTPAEVTPVLTSMFIDRVEIDCTGIAYGATTTLSVSGGASLYPVLDTAGRIIAVKVLNRGSGYTTAPTITVNDSGSLGNNAVLRAVIGSEIVSATVTEEGSGYEYSPQLYITSPVASVEMEGIGAGYTAVPSVTFSDPDDPAGTRAEGVACLGGFLDRLVIVQSGSGYSKDTLLTCTLGGSTHQAMVKVLVQGGAIVSADIIDPGYGYTGVPTLILSDTGGGSGAIIIPYIAGYLTGECGIAKITITEPGSGYTKAPTVTIGAPEDGQQATAQVKLLGFGARLTAELAGAGGLHRASVSTDYTSGNALQVYDFNEDLDDSFTAALLRPQAAAFYYNAKADPAFMLRWPSVPITKTSFMLNGTELISTEYQEGSGLGTDTSADIILTRRSIFWATGHQDGCPWDRNFQVYRQLSNTEGTDARLINTGFPGDYDHWWHWSEHLTELESERNRAWLHINRASRYHQSGKVVSLAALAPLRLVDRATGVDAKDDGSPMTGQLLLVLDNQTNLFTGTAIQIDLTKAGELQMIWQNNTGRNVFVSSVVITTIYQSNQGNLTPTVANCAKVTVGTQDGAYRNLIGVVSDTNTEGRACRLWANNQGKELFPDEDQAAALITPNQSVFLRVDLPAGAPISKQIAIARVKGHVL